MTARSTVSLAVVFLAALFATTSVMTTIDVEEATAAPRKVRKKKGKTGISKNRPIAGVKGGFVISGSGETDVEGQTGTTEYDDDSTYGLNAYALFPVAPNIRVGGSVWLWPKWDITATGDTSEPGDDDALGLDINVMGEYALDFGKADGFAFAEGGYSLVLPPKDDEAAEDPPAFSGFNFGGGIGGALYLSRQLALRADIKYEYYSVTADVDVGSSTFAVTNAGNRVTINAGIAFGL
jgi:hypothetical protein